jgi:integrase-like protein
MNKSTRRRGTAIAQHLRVSSQNSALSVPALRTIGQLLDILTKNPPAGFSMLRTTCSRLADYLEKDIDQLTIDLVAETRRGFRPFLEGRKYKENATRSYVYQAGALLRYAKEFGWKHDSLFSEAWSRVLVHAGERRCTGLVTHLARIRNSPMDVTIQDVDRWVELRNQQHMKHRDTATHKSRFWRLLRDLGCTEQRPKCLVREKRYGIPLEKFPQPLRTEVQELLRWKQAAFALGRPGNGQLREETARLLRAQFVRLLGFAVNVRGEVGITTMSQLLRQDIAGGYVEWCVNDREVKKSALAIGLGLLFAALRHHPGCRALDIGWFKPLLDSLRSKNDSESRRRKKEHYVAYSVLEEIPAKIRAQRQSAQKRGMTRLARLVMEELVIRLLITHIWRLRNIRECRIGGPTPNLFKGPIPPYSEICKPQWVIQAETENPAAEFWQFKFSPEETKTKNAVHALIVKQLIEPLEEYLNNYRPLLVQGTDPETLFVNQAGKQFIANRMTSMISDLTLRYGGRRVTPHLVRDIVAYAWLDAHPEDYLSLSKLLWHRDLATTIKIYGRRFNESNGASRMEAWLEERASNSTRVLRTPHMRQKADEQ